MSVRTRFAPSPTGYLHIGGVRTALFNWLFARQHEGQFVLRIDDTDAGRNVESALAPILAGLKWLGLGWDEGPEVGGPVGPYFQSERTAHYEAAVAKLLEGGHAYRDFSTTEEIQAERESAEKEKRPFRYSRRFMAESEEDVRRFEAEGRSSVVRLKMPQEGVLVVNDLVRGDVEFAWGKEQDHVIQRADGSCLYHLATVVDDYELKISHVIRAEEHLSNTPRQIFIAQALGYELPTYAHLPYVAAPGAKQKLSKRKLDKYLKQPDFAKIHEHGKRIAELIGMEPETETFNPVIVDFYRDVGYLPEAVLNYLLLLGWSLDGETEFFSVDEMIRDFSLERVNQAPASFDPSKLMAFEDRYMQLLPIKRKVKMAVPFLQGAGVVAEPPSCDVGPALTQILEAAGDRVKVAGDVVDYADFFVADDAFAYDEKAFEKRLRKPAEAGELLEKFKRRLEAVDTFDVESLDAELHAFVDEEGIKIGQIIHALRVAITGKAVGFGVFDTLAILGKERSIARIERTLARLAESSSHPV